MKKVTLQEIAASLGISRTTVWKVFSGHEGVSDSLKSRIIAKAQELGYEFPEDFPLDPLPEDEPPVNIAVAVCRPETSLFWMNIIHQIAKEFSSSDGGFADSAPMTVGSNVDEAVNALMVLGYTRGEAASALKGLSATLSIEELITAALKKLAN